MLHGWTVRVMNVRGSPQSPIHALIYLSDTTWRVKRGITGKDICATHLSERDALYLAIAAYSSASGVHEPKAGASHQVHTVSQAQGAANCDPE